MFTGLYVTMTKFKVIESVALLTKDGETIIGDTRDHETNTVWIFRRENNASPWKIRAFARVPHPYRMNKII